MAIPSYCVLCDRSAIADPCFELPAGGRVRFRDYQPNRPGCGGDSTGEPWFCGFHLERASALSELVEADALAQLEELRPAVRPSAKLVIEAMSSRLPVMKVLRAHGRSLTEVRALLANVPVVVFDDANPQGVYPVALRGGLEEAGATVGVRW